MIEIIPAIIAKNFKELKEKVEMVAPYVKWVQLDIMDGKFVPNETWDNPEDLGREEFAVSFEAHLMINEPEKHVEKWIDAGVKRIIFHIEATSDPDAVIQACRNKKVEVGVAINPKTPIESVEPLLKSNSSSTLDMVLVMAVNPGFGGQEFIASVIPKIRALRHLHPHLTIRVDGGMNPKTAREAVAAGANAIVAGSYIFRSADIRKSIDELKNACLS